VRKRFQPDEEHVALTAAVSEALVTTLQHWTQDEELLIHYLHIFEKLTQREIVAGEISQLLDPRADAELDVDLLAREFQALDYDADWLGIDFALFLRQFTQAFSSAAARSDRLRPLLDTQALQTMVEQLGQMLESSQRTAAATERSADSLDDIHFLIQRIDQRQLTPAHLQEAIRTVLEHGFGPQFKLFESLITTVQKQGYDVTVLLDGSVEISGDTDRQSTAIDPTLIRQLQQEISLLRNAIVEHTPTDEELALLEQRYRNHIINSFESLTFQGMMSTARAIALPLEDVYVELRAVAEVPEAADAFSIEERRLLLEVDEEADERHEQKRQELLRQMDALRRERWSRTLPERQSIAQTLHSQDRRAFVILGDPGSGKSTLLRLLALVYAKGPESVTHTLDVAASDADRLPIFVPLAAFDDMLKHIPNLSLYEFFHRYYEQRWSIPGLRPLFERALTSGKAILLLDGLDEVLDATTRSYVSNQARALINEWSGRGVRFVVTSRFVGYRDAPLPGTLPHLSVLDFRQQEIEVFVHKWAHAYERWVAGGTDTPESTRRARDLEANLLLDVRSNPSVRRLAANPLMLTMLALLRRQVGRLPHRRILLYERYVNTLIENWVESRAHGERTSSLDILDLNEAESVLIPLSLWLQQEKPSGTAGRHEIQRQLTQIYLNEAGLDETQATKSQHRDAQQKAVRFLTEMRHMTGLIVERGHDAYGFLHLTFQEYFAGRALAQLDEDTRWQTLSPVRHNPRWREPLLLCAGRLGVGEKRRPQVTRLVQQILECPDDTETDLHRNLLLALAIAADDVNLHPHVIDDLGKRIQACLPTNIYQLARRLIDSAGMLASISTLSLSNWLSPITECSDTHLHRYMIEQLADYVQYDSIRYIVLQRLDDDSASVRQAAVTALAPLLPDHPDLRTPILQRLDDANWPTRQAAVTALAPLLPDHPDLRLTMLEFLSHFVEGHLQTIDQFENIRVVIGALTALWKATGWSAIPLPLSELSLNMLSIDISEYAVRSRVGIRIDWNDLNEQISSLQKEMARSLHQALAHDHSLRTRVFTLLNGPRMSQRFCAFRILLQPSADSPFTYLSKQQFDEALNDMRGLESYDARLAAASFLINRDTSSQGAIDVCLETLSYGTQWWEFLPESEQIRTKAATILSQLEALHYDERVYAALKTVMQQDALEEVRDAAYNALVRLARVRDEQVWEQDGSPTVSQIDESTMDHR